MRQEVACENNSCGSRGQVTGATIDFHAIKSVTPAAGVGLRDGGWGVGGAEVGDSRVPQDTEVRTRASPPVMEAVWEGRVDAGGLILRPSAACAVLSVGPCSRGTKPSLTRSRSDSRAASWRRTRRRRQPLLVSSRPLASGQTRPGWVC